VNEGRSWSADPGDDLENRSVRGAAATLSSQGVVFATRLVATSVLAHMLSPSDFGLVAMATPLVTFVMLFQDLGLSMATVQRKVLAEELVVRLFWVNVLAGFGLSAVTILCAPLVSLFFHDGRLTAITMALGGAFFIGGLGAQQRALLTREMRFGFLSGLQIVAVAMAYYKIEKAILEKLVFNPTENGGRVAFTYFRNNDADGVGPLLAQTPAHRVGGITIERRGMEYPLLSLLGNAMCCPSAVDNARDCGLRKLKRGGKLSQCYRFERGPGHLSILQSYRVQSRTRELPEQPLQLRIRLIEKVHYP